MKTRTACKLVTISLIAGAIVAGPVHAEDSGCAAWGEELFVNHCAPCHGIGGNGNGPAANALKTAPSDLRLISKTHDGHFPREWVEGFIDGTKVLGSHGKREMPIWGPALQMGSLGKEGAKAAISALTDYIASIQKK